MAAGHKTSTERQRGRGKRKRERERERAGNADETKILPTIC